MAQTGNPPQSYYISFSIALVKNCLWILPSQAYETQNLEICPFEKLIPIFTNQMVHIKYILIF